MEARLRSNARAIPGQAAIDGITPIVGRDA
jgi:hypothetical protein